MNGDSKQQIKTKTCYYKVGISRIYAKKKINVIA